jgi:hypothetical protein
MKKDHNDKPTFQVGDRVQFLFDGRKVRGEVVEDRGPIAWSGGQLLRVEVFADPFDSVPTIRDAEEVEPENPKEWPQTIDKAKLMQYLKIAGLVGILQHGMTTEKQTPRVWLCLNQLHNVTYTFVQERGLVGGAGIPRGALHEMVKIRKAKVAEVVAFLASFGLNAEEANEVIQAVGTAS